MSVKNVSSLESRSGSYVRDTSPFSVNDCSFAVQCAKLGA